MSIKSPIRIALSKLKKKKERSIIEQRKEKEYTSGLNQKISSKIKELDAKGIQWEPIRTDLFRVLNQPLEKELLETRIDSNAIWTQYKKVPFVSKDILRKLNKENKNEIIYTWSRATTILPFMVGRTIAVHNGRTHVKVFITPNHVGHKLGEFVPTRHVKKLELLVSTFFKKKRKNFRLKNELHYRKSAVNNEKNASKIRKTKQNQ